MISPETLARLDPLARTAGFYTAYQLSDAEFVGTVPYAIPGPLWWFPEKGGYEAPTTVAGVPLSAAKYHPETGELHTKTYRKVDPDNPRAQWHVHLWESFGESIEEAHYEVFSHYELRPDPWPVADETWRECIQRLREHYRPGESYVEGYACEAVTELVRD